MHTCGVIIIYTGLYNHIYSDNNVHIHIPTLVIVRSINKPSI